MFVAINELFVTDENRAVCERNFATGMHGTLPGVSGLRGARPRLSMRNSHAPHSRT